MPRGRSHFTIKGYNIHNFKYDLIPPVGVLYDDASGTKYKRGLLAVKGIKGGTGK
jgi:hypothetical protein